MKVTVVTRRVLTAGGTMLCAFGIGYFMQSIAQPSLTADTAAPVVDASESSNTAPQQDTSVHFTQPIYETTNLALSIDRVALTSASPQKTSTELPMPPEAVDQPHHFSEMQGRRTHLSQASNSFFLNTLPEEEVAPSFACDVQLEAEKALAAMAKLSLQAPCLPGMAFTMRHNGMAFSAVTDADGFWQAMVPALSQEAMFAATFDHGESATTIVTIDSVPLYDRFIVQWQGESGLEIHALEAGASYGSVGHIWAGAAGDRSAAVNGEGGFVVTFGESGGTLDDPVRMAQVYTIPSVTRGISQDVTVNVEAEVHEANCGRDVEAQMLVLTTQTGLVALDLDVAMPDCTATGEFVVLKNLTNDLTIALN